MGYGIRDTGYGIRDSGYGIRDWDTGYGIRDTGYGKNNLELGKMQMFSSLIPYTLSLLFPLCPLCLLSALLCLKNYSLIQYPAGLGTTAIICKWDLNFPHGTQRGYTGKFFQIVGCIDGMIKVFDKKGQT